MPIIRVLIVDDHALFRAGIRSLLQTLGDIEVVAEAADGHEALRLVEMHRPDVVLMDIMMPNLNGMDTTTRILQKSAPSRVIMLSMHTDADSVLKALRSGARGYVVKAADPAELETAIRTVVRGETFVSSAISGRVIESWLKQPAKDTISLERLTPRQREVLQLTAEGNSIKAIAGRLGISVKTVETHRADLMAMLDIYDVASLTRFAIRAGLVSVDR